MRYFRSSNGSLQSKARIYSQEDHCIDISCIDREALAIVNRLVSQGYSAYIVGGAVRDLLLGRRPKDFDIVTDALPNRIRKIFSNSRIIGRRFKLVHVYSNRKIYEVSTFRSLSNGTVGNEYGTISEDVRRRDFTVNALYFDPLASEILDFVGGVEDIHSGKLKAIIPLNRIFSEDPVRMVRGIKYASTNQFVITLPLRLAIRRDAPLLDSVSPSRLAEEFYKIIATGKSVEIIQALDRYGLLQYLLPEVHASIHGDKAFKDAFLRDLASLDLLAQAPESSLLNSVTAAEIIQADKRLISPFLAWFIRQRIKDFAALRDIPKEPATFRHEVFSDIRVFLSPLSLPRVALEEAMEQVLQEEDLLP
ncbi:MAG TPA: polynucleotide adenylyltransferase PcnB, partial [Rectinema sp.]|nr:polynucleotide adenylyltransferase PcnB [Rectinema sp.]HQQ32155.1 polynucleotide adenylyltransferase PcnB [Rectinema sp.]